MYRRLLSNTVLFSVSTFGSKILLFLLTPFYTSILTDAEYGVTDLIIQTGNVLIPLVSMGIINAVLRFGLDETTDLKGLFTTGLVVILVGEGACPVLPPAPEHRPTVGLRPSAAALCPHGQPPRGVRRHGPGHGEGAAVRRQRHPVHRPGGGAEHPAPVGVPAGNCGVCPLQRHRRRGGGAGAVCRPGAVAVLPAGGGGAGPGEADVPLLPAPDPGHRLLLDHQHLRPVLHFLPHRPRCLRPVRGGEQGGLHPPHPLGDLHLRLAAVHRLGAVQGGAGEVLLQRLFRLTRQGPWWGPPCSWRPAGW